MRRDNRSKVTDAELIEQLRSDVKALTGDDGVRKPLIISSGLAQELKRILGNDMTKWFENIDVVVAGKQKSYPQKQVWKIGATI
jgi:hypothetical protein